MAKFRKKPVVIDALQWSGVDFGRNLPEWLDIAFYRRGTGNGSIHQEGDELRVVTLEGTMTAKPGDWIIRGVQGELYPCKADIFTATYEPV